MTGLEAAIAAVTWKEIAAAVGVALTVIAAIYAYMTSPNRVSNWKELFSNHKTDTDTKIAEETAKITKEISDLKTEIKLLNQKMDSMDKEVEEVTKEQKELDIRVLQKMEKIEDKLDKFLDIFIQHYTNK